MNTQELLKNCKVEGKIVKLPSIQLERKDYLDLKKQLELIGGKWKGGKVQGFEFPEDPENLLNEIASGTKRNLKKEFQFFATPENIAKKLVALADIRDYDDILEPSCGQGAIIKEINRVTDSVPDCYELMDVNRSIIANSELKYNLKGFDFLEASEGKVYTKIIANPPFSKNQDIDHLYKMFSLLRPNGKIVSIMSESWLTGLTKKQVDFKSWLYEQDFDLIPLEKGTFKESGTMISSTILLISK